MKVFQDISDIDWNWVCLKEEFNYWHHDEISPKVLLADIRRRLCENRRMREKFEHKNNNER